MSVVSRGNSNWYSWCAQFSNPVWQKWQSTIPSENSVAPDGTLTAAILHEDDSPGTDHSVFRPALPQAQAGQVYCHSVYAKAINRNWMMIEVVGGNMAIWYNLATGTIGTVENFVDGRYGIIPCGNGWHRCWCAGTALVAAGTYSSFYACEVDGDYDYDGLNQNALYLWGPQFHRGYELNDFLPVLEVQRT